MVGDRRWQVCPVSSPSRYIRRLAEPAIHTLYHFNRSNHHHSYHSDWRDDMIIISTAQEKFDWWSSPSFQIKLANFVKLVFLFPCITLLVSSSAGNSKVKKEKLSLFFILSWPSVLKKHQRRKDRHHGGWSATKSTPIGDERFNRASCNIKPRSSWHSLQDDKKISFQFLYQPQNQQGCRDFKTDNPEAPSYV